jgi:threonine aldolase
MPRKEASMDKIDLRSDTVTWPTEKMRAAMAQAPVGDDVYGDDPTVIRLETLAAKALGKEAALFVPSGTFGNQLALYTWCPRGSEVILGDQCHIVQHEAGAAAIISGVQLRPIDAPKGILPTKAIAERIRGEDIHYPPTSLLCLENAHSSGRVLPLDYLDEVSSFAKARGLPVHMDGARIFNAAAALGLPPSRIAQAADSVMFCLSKGLCAPVGSMLAGPCDFIAQARKKRKPLGGGMRQVGILAAAGIIAIEEMTKRLTEDHVRARLLASKLSAIPGIQVAQDALDIDMVFFRLPDGTDGQAFASYLAAGGILANPPENGECRLVTHYWIDDAKVEKTARRIREFLAR